MGLLIILLRLCLTGAFFWLTLGAQASDVSDSSYFESETAKLSSSRLKEISSLADWQAQRPGLRREAAEMLGLSPLPERTELKPVITGRLDENDFTVEKLYFQSQPHLYVTANLYLPKGIRRPAPAILYLCGHTLVMTNGVSCGNKTAYQQHGIWFARNGYVCLIIDSLDLGEIRGLHRGTYSDGLWWWNSRGYTPAGVETWNAMRALDYLDSRPEVDPERMGVTGRSGGGAYSWFLAALDDRVKVIAPVAGMADLRSYIVDGKVDSHCDCMFMVNTYRWDYPLLAALAAPRPVLLANTDSDEFFPLSGVMRTCDQIKQVYKLYDSSPNFSVTLAPGPHRDTPSMQEPVFRWFDVHLKQQNTGKPMAAVKMFAPLALKVFDTIPKDEINTRIQNTFVPMAPCPAVPESPAAWRALQEKWMKQLKEKCFGGWPAESASNKLVRLSIEEIAGVRYEVTEIQTQLFISPKLYLMHKGNEKPRQIHLQVVDRDFPAGSKIWKTSEGFGTPDTVEALFVPRDAGPHSQDKQLRRRYMLLGQTLDGMRVWDIRCAIQALRAMNEFENIPIKIGAEGNMAVDALYASLFETGVTELDLRAVPSSHMEGPDYLNVLKILDIPQAAAMAASRCQLRLQPAGAKGWEFLEAMANSRSLGVQAEIVTVK